MKLWDLIPRAGMEPIRKMFMQQRGRDFLAQRNMEFPGPNGKAMPVELQGKVIRIGNRKYVQCFLRKTGK